jgi:hypothetical protein
VSERAEYERAKPYIRPALESLVRKQDGDIEGIERLMAEMRSPDVDATETVALYLIRQDQRVLELMDALHHIAGMCDVPGDCPNCGRPTGTLAVRAAALSALTAPHPRP